jgi:outer membrane lipoprotein
MIMKNLIYLFMVVFLSACSSEIPQNIRQAPSADLSLSEVVNKAITQTNQSVRWGGSILAINNTPKNTELEILAMNLDPSGKPVNGNKALGRFLVETDGVADPAIYAKGQLLTIYGVKNAVSTRNIGDLPYAYPVVQAKTLYLWPQDTESAFPYDCTDDLGTFGYYFNSGYSPYGGQYCLGHSW